METRKYRLTKETMEWSGHTLHRIEALKDFGDVKERETRADGLRRRRILPAMRRAEENMNV